MSREAMQLAIEALELYQSRMSVQMFDEAVRALRQALEVNMSEERVDETVKQEHEPVAFINVEKQKLEWAKLTSWHTPTIVNLPKIPLYTAPPKQWVGLTDEEIFSILENLQTIYNRPPTEDSRIIFAKTVEQALKEKNHG
jgi:hypothetical protein